MKTLHIGHRIASGSYSKSKGKSLRCLRKNTQSNLYFKKISFAALLTIGCRMAGLEAGGPERRLWQLSKREVMVVWATRVMSNRKI